MLHGTFARSIEGSLTELLYAKPVYSLAFILQKMVIDLNTHHECFIGFSLFLECINNH